MSAIAVRGVYKAYGDRPVLERVSLDIAAGSFVAVVGASGCGKSTFLRLLLSQERPDRGEIRVDGQPIAPEPMPDRGIVFQRYSVFPHLTVEENLILGLEFQRSPRLGRLFGAARRRARDDAEAMLAAVGLDHARALYPEQLSGGMQQRLAIGQALLMAPKVLLMDEPFGALDPGIRADMHRLISGLWRERGMTVLLVTHDLSEAFALGTRLLAFDKVRHDPVHPAAYCATVTYDIPIERRPAPPPPLQPGNDQEQGSRPHAEPS